MRWLVVAVILLILAITWYRSLPFRDFGSPRETLGAGLTLIAIAVSAIYLAIKNKRDR